MRRIAACAGRFQRVFTFFGGSLAREPQDWKRYTVSLLVFNVLMFVVCFGDPGVAAVPAAQPGRQGRARAGT